MSKLKTNKNPENRLMKNLNAVMSALLLLAGANAIAAVAETRTVSYAYDADGFRVQETIEPDSPEYLLRTSYQLDAYGNRIAITQFSQKEQDAGRTASRTTTVTYDASGRFLASTVNPVSHKTETAYHAAFGLLRLKQMPDGVGDVYYLDGMGRIAYETRQDNWGKQTTYNLCSSNASSCAHVSGAFYFTLQQSYHEDDDLYEVTAAPQRVFYDVLNRVVRSEVMSMDGRWSGVDTVYDQQGRVIETSRPYFIGDARYADRKEYDDLNRVAKETKANGNVITYSYAGFRATATNKLNDADTAGQQTTKMRDSRDQIVAVWDAKGSLLQMIYAPFGNLDRTFDAYYNKIDNEFDRLGRKVKTADPDMGTWTYSYDGWGRLRTQTNGKNQTATYGYDLIDRKTSLVEADLASYWEYDNCSYGKGKLCVSRSDNGYRQDLSYSWLGYPSKTVTQLDGQAYTVTSDIDGHGRLLQQGYPASPAYPNGLKVSYAYDAFKGYITRVFNAGNGQTYWTPKAMDAEGHYTSQMLGDPSKGLDLFNLYNPRDGRIQTTGAKTSSMMNLDYTWDTRGNLRQRIDYNAGFSESFLYDELNRITAVQNAQQATLTFAYNELGNITYRSDVGHYTYGSNRPHAVTATFGTVNASFAYDDNGAQISGNGRTIQYTSFNLPSFIQKGSWTDQFIYGPDHQRLRQVNPDSTIYYLNPDNAGGLLFEKEVKSDGITEYKHYINAGGQTIALYTSRSNGVHDTKLWFKDYQGSLTTVTDENGNVLERLSYEAFGKRRQINGAPDAGNQVKGMTSDRGYTGHEHLDEVGLIHMNGRVYDPLLARFVSPDPHITYPEWMQSYNRYSYVLNNPFAYTDPTGFDVGDDADSGPEAGQNYSDGQALSETPADQKGTQDAAKATESKDKGIVDTVVDFWNGLVADHRAAMDRAAVEQALWEYRISYIPPGAEKSTQTIAIESLLAGFRNQFKDMDAMYAHAKSMHPDRFSGSKNVDFYYIAVRALGDKNSTVAKFLMERTLNTKTTMGLFHAHVAGWENGKKGYAFSDIGMMGPQGAGRDSQMRGGHDLQGYYFSDTFFGSISNISASLQSSGRWGTGAWSSENKGGYNIVIHNCQDYVRDFQAEARR